MFTLGAESVSWQPDLERETEKEEKKQGKSWRIHYRELLRVLRKKFGNDKMRGMGLYYNYSLNGDINSNEIRNCNKLDDATIEKFWYILNNNNVSTMSFIICKNAPSPPNHDQFEGHEQDEQEMKECMNDNMAAAPENMIYDRGQLGGTTSVV